MEQPATIMPITKDEFWAKYWFSPLQMVTLVNPKPYDYKFMVEMRNFVIGTGKKEKMPGTVANVYLSQMTRIMAQDDDQMALLSDFALMRQYYDKLIVNVESLVNEVSNVPAYLNNVPEHMKVESESETPPWQEPVKSAIPETNSDMSNVHTTPDHLPKAEPARNDTRKEATKEFELEGAKYKMTIDKNDKETFFKNGVRVSAADYSKAASMI